MTHRFLPLLLSLPFALGLGAQQAGSGPTFPRRAPIPSDATPDTAQMRRDIEDLLATESRILTRATNGRTVWPVRLKPKFDCFESAAVSRDSVGVDGRMSYNYSPELIVVETSALVATETGSIALADTTSRPLRSRGRYLRVWKRENGLWIVNAACVATNQH